MTIKSITIVKSYGADCIMLQTDLPEAVYASEGSNLNLTFNAAKDTGVEYCKQHFPEITIKEIEV